MTDNRMYGLDLLRAFLMFFGPIVHVGQIFSKEYIIIPEQNIYIRVISSFASPFRMELFFVLSGFFSSLVIEKKGIEYFKWRRKNNLFLPLFFALLVVIPLTNLFFYDHIDSFSSLYMNIHHIWFLLSLGLITIFVIFFIDEINLYIKIINKFPKKKVIIIFAILYSGLFLLRFYFYDFNFPSVFNLVIDNFLLLPLIYLVPFLLGMIVYKWNLNFNLNFNYFLFSLFLYTLVFIFVQYIKYTYALTVEHKILLKSIVVISSSLLMFYTFFYFKTLKIKKSSYLTFLTKSAMPFYLVHQFVVFALAVFLKNKIQNDLILFLFLCTLTYIISFVFSYVVLKNRVLKIIFGVR